MTSSVGVAQTEDPGPPAASPACDRSIARALDASDAELLARLLEALNRCSDGLDSIDGDVGYLEGLPPPTILKLEQAFARLADLVAKRLPPDECRSEDQPGCVAVQFADERRHPRRVLATLLAKGCGRKLWRFTSLHSGDVAYGAGGVSVSDEMFLGRLQSGGQLEHFRSQDAAIVHRSWESTIYGIKNGVFRRRGSKSEGRCGVILLSACTGHVVTHCAGTAVYDDGSTEEHAGFRWYRVPVAVTSAGQHTRPDTDGR